MSYILGLTGGIASGKSTASAYLRGKGLPVIDADAIARQVTAPGSEVLQEIKKTFGQEMLTVEGALDRRKLGRLVFADEQERMKLNQLTHTAIRREIEQQLDLLQREGTSCIVLDVPLLFETGYDALCDGVMVIAVPYEVQKKRLRERNALSEEEAERRIASQMPLAEKVRRADFVIDNSGSPKMLQQQLDNWLEEARAFLVPDTNKGSNDRPL